ncbi:MAG: surface polysaccharide O-acyltransferase-like enzyme [Granulosicoccus sp.]|jgi:surface polysaccharide O-acyltransferase-like enzyme
MVMRADIEVFRIISAFAVVWFHSGEIFAKDASYGGLVFFAIVSIYFNTKSSSHKTITDRTKRLLLPCLTWSLIYACFNLLLKGRIYPEDYGALSAILSTPSIHLWYLPYIFIVVVIADQVKKALSKNVMGIGFGVSAIVILLLAPVWRELEYIQPLGQYAHALPAVFIGLYLACFFNMQSKVRLIILVGIVCAILLMTIISQPGIGITYLVGTIPCLLLLIKNPIKKPIDNVSAISSLMLGVYCIHIIPLRVLRHIHIEGYVLPLLAFLSSIIFIWTAKKLLSKRYSEYFM